MAKKVAGQLKLQVPAGKANPSPPVGPGAGSARHQHHGVLQGVQRPHPGDGGRPADARSIITYFTDKSFHDGDQDAAGVVPPEEGGEAARRARRRPGKAVAGSVTLAQLREIAEAKMKDLNANDVEAAMQIIAGSARSMGIEVKG